MCGIAILLQGFLSTCKNKQNPEQKPKPLSP